MKYATVLESARYYSHEMNHALKETGLSKLVKGLSEIKAVPAVDLQRVSALFEDTMWVGQLGLRWLGHHAGECPGVSVFPGGLADGGADVIKTGLVFRNQQFAVALQAFDSLMLRTVRASLVDASVDVILGRSSVLKVIGGGALICQVTDFDEISPNQDLDLAIAQLDTRTIQLDDKSRPLEISGKRQAIRFLDSVGDPLVLNVTCLVDALPFRLHVARSTGEVVSVMANDEADNVVRTMMTVLRQLGADQRADLLQRYADHPAHFVRWHALRELALLKPALAVQSLKKRLAVESSSYLKRNLENLQSYLEAGGMS